MKKGFITDPGFGTRPNSQRLINNDGSFNLKRKGLPWGTPVNIYHNLISMSWSRFILLTVSAYISVNFLFAFIYFLLPEGELIGIVHKEGHKLFGEYFFFSAQTLTTVGYGRVNPVGPIAGYITSLESMTGLMIFALATGLIYGKFSRPMAKILYSKEAIIAPYQGGRALMFRIANLRNTQIVDLNAKVLVSWVDEEKGIRQYRRIGLERDSVDFFPTTWTIVHPVTEESLLWEKKSEDLGKMHIEIMVLIRGFDQTFSQTVYSQYSYVGDEILWGARFRSIYENATEQITVDLKKISDYEYVIL